MHILHIGERSTILRIYCASRENLAHILRIDTSSAQLAHLAQNTISPHRAVLREEHNTTKTRVVFDASSKLEGSSLNEQLHQGPCLLPLLFDILCWFRMNEVALVSDLCQAFLQIEIATEHTDYLHFFVVFGYDENYEAPIVPKLITINRLVYF